MKRFSAAVAKFEGTSGGYHIKVPQEIFKYFFNQQVSRFRCRLNEEITIPCALNSAGDGTFYVYINKTLHKKLGLEVGDEISVCLEADTSKYGMPMPEELAELLRQDPEGDKAFHALTPGRQRSMIYMVSKPKSSERRLHKALAIIEFLKTFNGKVDFSQMNNFIKRFGKHY